MIERVREAGPRRAQLQNRSIRSEPNFQLSRSCSWQLGVLRRQSSTRRQVRAISDTLLATWVSPLPLLARVCPQQHPPATFRGRPLLEARAFRRTQRIAPSMLQQPLKPACRRWHDVAIFRIPPSTHTHAAGPARFPAARSGAKPRLLSLCSGAAAAGEPSWTDAAAGAGGAGQGR